MKKRFAPKEVIPETQREWKKKKRAEWKAVLKAAHMFLAGAAYTPADDSHNPPVFYPGMLDDMQKIQKKLSVKEWGR